MNPKPIPVILDTDIGTDIDDTWALAMLLGSPELDLKLVLTEHGDTRYRARLAAKLLERAGHADIPIGIGVQTEMNVGAFQAPWVAAYDLDQYPGPVYADGVQAMIDLVLSAEETVTVIAIGVVTNLAEALRREPRIASRCRFVGMHGSIFMGYDGSAVPSLEANVRNDPASLRDVFAAPWLEKVITPLDTCGRIVLEGELYQQVRRHASPMIQALMENYRIWAAEMAQYATFEPETRSSTLFDTVAIYLAHCRERLSIEEIPLQVTDEGLTVVDPAGDLVQAAIGWTDLPGFYQHLVSRLCSVL
ncbi:MAG: nucleoside hydrolase [Anaerolineae bacterium]|nr:nucleoside hydrolase [Anaerolineae bacterium]